MKKPNRRFSLYLTKDDPEGRRIRGQPYLALNSDKQYVNTDHYRRIYMGDYEERESLKHLMPRIRKALEDILPEPVGTSDVLMLSREGEPLCYYIEGDRLRLIKEFIRVSTEGSVVNERTKDFVIEGRQGSWDTLDRLILDGCLYYLMENQKYKDAAKRIVVDSSGKPLVHDIKEGFDDTVKMMIREAKSRPGGSSIAYQQQKDVRKETISDAKGGQDKASAGNKLINVSVDPDKRKSVMKKLREKQIEIARKSGKPVPAYLQYAQKS